jgi:hypothetical protein
MHQDRPAEEARPIHCSEPPDDELGHNAGRSRRRELPYADVTIAHAVSLTAFHLHRITATFGGGS